MSNRKLTKWGFLTHFLAIALVGWTVSWLMITYLHLVEMSYLNFMIFYIPTVFLLLTCVVYERDLAGRTVEANWFFQPSLTPEELAYLAGGSNRAIDTVILYLFQHRRVSFLDDGPWLYPYLAGDDLQDLAGDVMAAIGQDGKSVSSVRYAVADKADKLRDNFKKKGLFLEQSYRVRSRYTWVFIPLALAGLGFVRSAHSSLQALLEVVLILNVSFVWLYSKETTAVYGDIVLKRAKSGIWLDHYPDEFTEIRYAFATWGCEALKNTPWVELAAAIKKSYSRGGGCGGCGGCGGGDGGDGGCSGGGCGGCGGCGG